MVFGVIINNSVLAKKFICRCEPNSNEVLYETLKNAAKSSPTNFYCYDYFGSFSCEMYTSERPEFEESCMKYDPDIMGTFCRWIKSDWSDTDFREDIKETLSLNKQKVFNEQTNKYEYKN